MILITSTFCWILYYENLVFEEFILQSFPFFLAIHSIISSLLCFAFIIKITERADCNWLKELTTQSVYIFCMWPPAQWGLSALHTSQFKLWSYLWSSQPIHIKTKQIFILYETDFYQIQYVYAQIKKTYQMATATSCRIARILSPFSPHTHTIFAA